MANFILACMLCAPSAWAAGKPFWVERDAYVEAEYVYAVGAAEGSSSREKGRKDAMADARDALADFVQLTELGRLKSEVIREHISDRADGSVDVYMLLRTLYEPLVRLKKEVDTASLARLDRLARIQEKSFKDLSAQFERLDKVHAQTSGVRTQLEELVRNIERTSGLATGTVRMGMTEVEVAQVAGPAVQREKCGSDLALNYRKVWILLKSGVAACYVATERYTSPCMACNAWGAAPLK
ncbi:MAG: hypothetical protein HY924_02870 [Elusimicrobia bacterium]|nr:hypothetical protein [Elusimicrobiota bacterium]